MRKDFILLFVYVHVRRKAKHMLHAIALCMFVLSVHICTYFGNTPRQTVIFVKDMWHRTKRSG